MYDLIAENYSELFPPDPHRCGFVTKEIGVSPADTSILDIGCATGDLSFELADRGCTVTGIDLNKKMIDLAITRAGSTDATPPRFLCRSMLELEGLGLFNGAVCFGNTLPHLPTTDDVQTFMKGAGEVLYSGGKLIIQIINFDNLIGRKTFSFPDIDTEKAVFNRRYDIAEDGMINFIITLQDKLSGEEKSDSTRLLPLYSGTMKDMLTQAGFHDIKVYSGYDRKPSDGSEAASIYSASA